MQPRVEGLPRTPALLGPTIAGQLNRGRSGRCPANPMAQARAISMAPGKRFVSQHPTRRLHTLVEPKLAPVAVKLLPQAGPPVGVIARAEIDDRRKADGVAHQRARWHQRRKLLVPADRGFRLQGQVAGRNARSVCAPSVFRRPRATGRRRGPPRRVHAVRGERAQRSWDHPAAPASMDAIYRRRSSVRPSETSRSAVL